MTPQVRFALFILLSVLVAAVISFAATPLVKKLAISVGAIDVPKDAGLRPIVLCASAQDNRRMHKKPIPRLGGLAIFIAFVVSVLLFAEIGREMRGILLGALIIVALGVLDDIIPVLRDVVHGDAVSVLSDPG